MQAGHGKRDASLPDPSCWTRVFMSGTNRVKENLKYSRDNGDQRNARNEAEVRRKKVADFSRGSTHAATTCVREPINIVCKMDFV